MGSFYSKDALCPYYQYDDPAGRAVVCEGFAPGSTIRSRFPSKDAFQKYLKDRCCDNYKGCTWYKVATLKWKEPGD